MAMSSNSSTADYAYIGDGDCEFSTDNYIQVTDCAKTNLCDVLQHLMIIINRQTSR